MKITVFEKPANDTQVYLERLKEYPSCQPVIDNSSSTYTFVLPLDDDSFFLCGTSRLKNKITRSQIFYHKVIIERNIEDDLWSQEAVTVRCIVPSAMSFINPHDRHRRQVIEEPDLPANFSESAEELIDFSGSVTGRAPMPLLNIAVKQNGEFVDTALNVSPGTPLEMIIYLDDVSSRVYGLLTTFLRVTDNTPRKQEEVIILNGCSIDPYIFSNFETEDDGKSLSAKFRAFKFPDSNYVLFVGTVNVCLKSCLGVQCGEGQIGYGRKRRSYDPLPTDPNKVFEAELTAVVRVGYNNQQKATLYASSSSSTVPKVPAIMSSVYSTATHSEQRQKDQDHGSWTASWSVSEHNDANSGITAAMNRSSAPVATIASIPAVILTTISFIISIMFSLSESL